MSTEAAVFDITPEGMEKARTFFQGEFHAPLRIVTFNFIECDRSLTEVLLSVQQILEWLQDLSLPALTLHYRQSRGLRHEDLLGHFAILFDECLSASHNPSTEIHIDGVDLSQFYFVRGTKLAHYVRCVKLRIPWGPEIWTLLWIEDALLEAIRLREITIETERCIIDEEQKLLAGLQARGVEVRLPTK